MKKKIGTGTLSLVLVIIALIWSYNILDFCIGDQILSLFNLPTWSNHGVNYEVTLFSIVPFTKNGQSVHYTVFYSLILLIPALIIAIKNRNHLFANIGMWLALIFIILLAMSPIIVLL